MRSALPYCVLDLVEKLLERAVVFGVARQHFVGQRKTLRRDDQRDDHLHTVAALVAAVAKTPLVIVILRRIGLEIGAGQIIEQDLEAQVEQIAPAPDQVIEQRLFVLEQKIVTAIELVGVGQRTIG